jgi:hypothetical protein
VDGQRSSASGDEGAAPADHGRKPTRPPSADPVLPDVTRDESDSWGERPDDEDDLERFRRERPPHHL